MRVFARACARACVRACVWFQSNCSLPLVKICNNQTESVTAKSTPGLATNYHPLLRMITHCKYLLCHQCISCQVFEASDMCNLCIMALSLSTTIRTGIKIWNCLGNEIILLPSLQQFKEKFKSLLLSLYL